MSIHGLVRSAAIGIAVYGAVKVVEFVGICKGVYYGAHAAVNNPDEAREAVEAWDDASEKWEELKIMLKTQYKKA